MFRSGYVWYRVNKTLRLRLVHTCVTYTPTVVCHLLQTGKVRVFRKWFCVLLGLQATGTRVERVVFQFFPESICINFVAVVSRKRPPRVALDRVKTDVAAVAEIRWRSHITFSQVHCIRWMIMRLSEIVICACKIDVRVTLGRSP